jgi:hypothetical protein
MGWKATGTWHGHYEYDSVPDCPDLPARVGFGMRLRQSWPFGSLAGEVWDEPPGPPDRGVVEGRVSGGGVFFLKWMPVYRMWWDGRLVTFAEYLLREFDLPPDEPVPHPPIRYTGEYRAAGDELAGTWEYPPGTTRVISRGRAWAFDHPVGSGRWVALRVPAPS